MRGGRGEGGAGGLKGERNWFSENLEIGWHNNGKLFSSQKQGEPLKSRKFPTDQDKYEKVFLERMMLTRRGG